MTLSASAVTLRRAATGRCQGERIYKSRDGTTTLRFGRPMLPGSQGAAAQFVVGVAVAGHPARQFLVRVGAAGGVDFGDVLRVLGELDDQPVGGGDVDRLAIAVVGLA